MLDEVLVIRESIPLFYYNSDPNIAMSDDWYLLQSGFFVALSQFANETSHEKLKYIVLENKLYALDEASSLLLIFGDKEQLSDEVVAKLQNDISKAAKYLEYLIDKHNIGSIALSNIELSKIAVDFGDYLKTEKLVLDDSPFDPKQSRSLMQKFIFKSIGYVPGQCNIGPAERAKRLLTGIGGFILAIIGAFLIYFFEAAPLWTLILAPAIFFGFYGLFQYFFKFCVVNGLSKKFDMR